VDAALERRPPHEDRGLLEAFLKATPHSDTGSRTNAAYLDGRLRQRAGQFDEAIGIFAALAASDDVSARVHLRLAQSLAAAGQREAAESHLRKLLGKGAVNDRGLWETWMLLAIECHGGPQGALEKFPAPGTESAEQGKSTARGGTRSSCASDIRWLLEQLTGGGPIRIDCGSPEEYVDAAGELWGRDRFFRGGALRRKAPCKIFETPDQLLYKSHRKFTADGHDAGYRVPLPSGSYRLTLHFWDEKALGCRDDPVDVLVEGAPGFELAGCHFRGYAAAFAGRGTRDVRVQDGSLDIEFRSRGGVPMLAAIEIEWAN
jgi:hypothetical protein